MNAWFVGHIGDNVLIRVVRQGNMVLEEQFDLDGAENLVTKLLAEIRLLRPPPPPKGLRVVK